MLYSSEFRRLAGVTQVGAAHERFLLHNRLTHSLKVAQIGRRIAQRLIHPQHGSPALVEVINPDVVETAGLTHDIGHPPFGHSAEVVLDERLQDCGGFEGNAQSFHIITRLARLSGLNLTDRSLAATLKYPCFRDQKSRVAELRKADGFDIWTDRSFGNKWGAYRSDESYYAFARGDLADQPGALKFQRTPEAILMDWADDVSFATHDFEDYLSSGLISLAQVSSQIETLTTFTESKMAKLPGFDSAKLEKAFRSIAISTTQGLNLSKRGSESEFAQITNTLIELLVDGVYNTDSFPYIAVSADAQYLAEALKAITSYYVIESSPTAIARAGQTRMVGDLFDNLSEWVISDHENPRVPSRLQGLHARALRTPEVFASCGYNDTYVSLRSVSDYICTLTEAQTIDMAQRFAGSAPASMFGSWF